MNNYGYGYCSPENITIKNKKAFWSSWLWQKSQGIWSGFHTFFFFHKKQKQPIIIIIIIHSLPVIDSVVSQERVNTPLAPETYQHIKQLSSPHKSTSNKDQTQWIHGESGTVHNTSVALVTEAKLSVPTQIKHVARKKINALIETTITPSE